MNLIFTFPVWSFTPSRNSLSLVHWKTSCTGNTEFVKLVIINPHLLQVSLTFYGWTGNNCPIKYNSTQIKGKMLPCSGAGMDIFKVKEALTINWTVGHINCVLIMCDVTNCILVIHWLSLIMVGSLYNAFRLSILFSVGNILSSKIACSAVVCQGSFHEVIKFFHGIASEHSHTKLR
jgi:hypothetical protein